MFQNTWNYVSERVNFPIPQTPTKACWFVTCHSCYVSIIQFSWLLSSDPISVANISKLQPCSCTWAIFVLCLKVDSGGAPWSPLHIAVRQGHLDCVKLLIQAGADVNSVNAGKHTPLHEAAYRGYDAVLCELLIRGADPHAKSNQRRSPLHEACMQGIHLTVFLYSKIINMPCKLGWIDQWCFNLTERCCE